MVVVLRGKEEVVYQSHRLLQPGMQLRAGNGCRIEGLGPFDQSFARAAKMLKNCRDGLGVVLGLVRLAILQVRRCKFVSISQEIVHAGQPQRFEVEQVSRMFLGGPFLAWLSNQDLATESADQILEPRRRATQARAEVGMKLYREREFKFALKPEANRVHSN